MLYINFCLLKEIVSKGLMQQLREPAYLCILYIDVTQDLAIQLYEKQCMKGNVAT